MAYATTSDLSTWLGEQTVPANAGRLLDRASEVVDEAIVIRFNPDDTDTAAVLRDATCAQVEWWNEVGESADVEGEVTSASIGQVSLQFGSGDQRIAPAVVARRTLRVLRNGGLLYRGAQLA